MSGNSFWGIECGGPAQYPKFDYSMDNSGIMVLSASNSSSIESFDISFGDGTHVTGANWLGNISHPYPLMDVFEVQIQYTQKRVVGGFTCKNDGCSSFTIKTPAINATNDLKSNNLIIYPNPANDYLYIDTKHLMIIESDFKLFNFQGAEQSLSLESVGNRISIRHLIPGVYYLQLLTGSKMYYQKFIKL